ncbi:MAG: family 10 glycosylhydrolase [Sumerlaeia bacterium]
MRPIHPTKSFLTTLLMAALAVALAAPAVAQNPEMRAYWVSRFLWPAGGETSTKANIRAIFDELVDNNFNAVLFQVRGQCDVYYPSPYEPWSSPYGWTDPGWDPLQFAIDEAHARGLELHAYINTHTISQPVPPANTTPQHILNLHGPDSAEPWVIHDESGAPQGTVDGYVWMSPGIPEASWWTRRAIMHIVENYDIDGLHFDRIRTPGPEFSHDPISEARFAGDGNPDGLDWGGFMRSQITRDLRKIYGATALRKSNITISSAPFGICRKVPGGYQGFGTESYHSWYQDSFGWMESHVMDVLFPQIYWEIGSDHPFEVLLDDFQRFDGGRYVYPGINVRNDEVAQILQSRSQGALGTVLWPGVVTDFAGIKAQAYTEPATVPELPWKTDPQTAIVVGTVRDALGNPILDAKINMTGDAYNYLSAWDGFYTILDVAPGTYTVRGQKTGVGNGQGTVTVDAGDVVELNLLLSTSAGQVSLDREEYLVSDTPRVRLVDTDLVNESVAEVSISSPAASRTLELAAEGGGVFAADLPISRNGAEGTFPVELGGTLTVSYADAFDGTGPATVMDAATISEFVVFYDNPLDEDPGWTGTGEWAFGQPTGQAGTHGGPDPTSGHTGANVLGYNLTGAYVNDMATTETLTSAPIDVSGGHSTKLRFQRWLQVEQSRYDRANLQASADGATWTTIWENPDVTIEDTAWGQVEFDLSNVADGADEIFLRWGMGPTDVGWTYAGWNIDDIELLHIPVATQPAMPWSGWVVK